jgi:AcrR family transcriptional regulator
MAQILTMVKIDSGQISPTASQLESRRERRKAEKRRRIRDAALDLFARQGLAATRVEQITVSADVSKGTFFNYYRSKEAVLVEAYHEAFRAVLVELAHARATSFRGRIVELYAALADSVRDRRSFVTAVFRESLTEEMVRGLEDDAGPRLRAVLCDYVVEAQRAGEVRAELDARLVAEMLMGLWTMTLFSWAVSGGDFDLGTVLTERLDLLLGGVATTGAASVASSNTRRGA